MKKKLTPEEVMEFIENTKIMIQSSQVATGSTLISLRVPNALLKAFKLKCQSEDKSYQTEIKRLMQESLLKKC